MFIVKTLEEKKNKKKITYNLAWPRNSAANILIYILSIFSLHVYITKKYTYMFTKYKHIVLAIF